MTFDANQGTRTEDGSDLVASAFAEAQAALALIPRTCGKCGATVEASGNHCPNPKCRGWLPKNIGAAKDLQRSQQVKEFVVTSTERAELEGDLLTDLGGASNLSTMERTIVESLAFKIILRRNSTMPKLAKLGVVTARDRQRSILDADLRLDEAIRKDMALLKLERRAKQVPDPLAYAEGRVDA